MTDFLSDFKNFLGLIKDSKSMTHKTASQKFYEQYLIALMIFKERRKIRKKASLFNKHLNEKNEIKT
jgi:hypothetical protein